MSKKEKTQRAANQVNETNEESTMTNTKESNPTTSNREQFVTETNRAYNAVQRSNKKLFDIVTTAILSLESDKDELAKYKREVDVDRSTINKMQKICQSSVVQSNIERLPESWMTLYEVVQLEKSSSSDMVNELIEKGDITPSSTKKEITNLKDNYSKKESKPQDKPLSVSQEAKESRPYADSASSTPAQTIFVDYSVFETKEKIKAKYLIKELESLGFKVTTIPENLASSDTSNSENLPVAA